MAEISKRQQQRTGWVIIAVALATPFVLIALGVEPADLVKSLVDDF